MMHTASPRYINMLLVFSWLLITVIKLYLHHIVLFNDAMMLKMLFTVLFWLTGSLLIIFMLIKNDLKLDMIGICLFLFIALSLLNYKLLTFVFSLLVWYSIARLVSPSQFNLIYPLSLILLILAILMTVWFYGQTYYLDGRYGSVASFGFANSNSFPQLLIILLLAFSSRFNWSLLLALLLFVLFYGTIKTRTFYIMLALYPGMLFIARYGFPMVCSKVVFIFTSLALICVWLRDMPWIAELDNLLSWRFSFSGQLLENMQGMRDYLAGVPYLTSQKLAIPMDISYIVNIFQYGIPASCFLGWLYMRAIKGLVASQQYAKIAFILCFLMYAMVENVLINYLLNPGLFYVFHTLRGITASPTLQPNAIRHVV